MIRDQLENFCDLDLEVTGMGGGDDEKTLDLYLLSFQVWTKSIIRLASCKSALNTPVVCSTDRSKAVVPVLVLLFVALWFILRGDLLYIFPCVILFLCFSVL